MTSARVLVPGARSLAANEDPEAWAGRSKQEH
jgi:hypothetical protein